MFENFWKWVAMNVKPYLEEEVEPPVPVEEDWMNWWNKPQEEWPREVNGAKVGYVHVNVATSPLYKVEGEANIPLIYEDEDLRENNNTNAKRIIAKQDKWLMVYAKGDYYKHISKVIRPFGENIDGTAIFYLVMKEQIVDGINLWDINKDTYIPLYAYGWHIDKVLE